MKKLLLAIIIASIPLHLHAEARSSFIDYKYVKPNTTLDKVLNSSEIPEDSFILNDSLLRINFVSNKNAIKKLYKAYNPDEEQIPLTTDRTFTRNKLFVTRSVESIITYLLKGYTKSTGPVKVPLVLVADKNRESFAYSTIHDTNDSCYGYGIVESYIKDLYNHDHDHENEGLIEIAYHPDIKLSDETSQLNQIPNNSLTESFSYNLFSSIPQLLGFRSNIDRKGFHSPKSSLDKVLYTDFKDGVLPDEITFSEIHDNCFVNSIDACRLYIKTDPLKSLFEVKSDPDNLIKLNAKEYPYIHYAMYLKPFVNLPRTILSSGTFINYGFYTEADLEILNALGYKINPKEFFGNSLFSSGTHTKRQSIFFSKGFSAWSDDINDYRQDHISKTPLSIGTHIYGNYNDVTQQGTIASVGYGSVGIRVDGVKNTVTIPKKTSIIENGYDSSGIAVTYGRDNIININGNVNADTEGGIAVNINFGSNVLSDYVEYQGSYHRVRTLDVKEKRLNREKGELQDAPSEIRGPLVSRLNITGNISGNKNSIYIDDSAHVKEINITDRAKINGDIVSLWEPYEDENNHGLYIANQHVDLIPGKVQLDYNFNEKSAHAKAKVLDSLQTRIYLGTELTKKDFYDTDQSVHTSYKGNPKANIYIDGNIIGKTFTMLALGGSTHITGHLDINKLIVSNAALDIKTPSLMTNYINTVDLSKGGQLNLANSNPEVLVIRNLVKATANSVISVDTKLDGTVVDAVIFLGDTRALDGVVNFEPGLSYNEIKSLSSDPKALLNLLNKFVKDRNFFLSHHGLTMKFPRHIWYTQGQMGRKVKCTIRGCYLGDFVKSYAYSSEKLPFWRYVLSFSGIFIMLLGIFIVTRSSRSSRFG